MNNVFIFRLFILIINRRTKMELIQKPAVDQSLISVVTELKNVIDFQSNSVVSRTVIKKPTGTLTFFAFDEGEALSEHTAPFDAVANIIEGTAEVIINGESFILTDGQMIIMPANVPHAVKAEKKFKMMLIMIKD